MSDLARNSRKTGPPAAERRLPTWTRLKPYALAFGLVTLASLTAEGLFHFFNLARLSPIFLASVLVSAVWLGARPAFFAAVCAFSVYNFYTVEPRFSMRLDTPEEYLTLAVFLAVALMTGGLAGRVRDEARRSQARALTLSTLFEAAREMSSTEQEEALRGHLAWHIAHTAGGEAEILHGGQVWRAGTAAADPERPWASRPLTAQGVDLGLARWRPSGAQVMGDEEVQASVQVMAEIGAAAIARSRLANEKARIETVAQTEQLRTALLASVSHDFRTPLTAILTSTTSLQEYGERFDPSVRADLLATIQEEAERLNGYVANLLNFTKLESGALAVDMAPISAPETLGRIVRRYGPRTSGRALLLRAERNDLYVQGDAFLLEQVLANLLENAIRFSPQGSTLTLLARRDGPEVLVEVLDEGPGVDPAERELIFDKFYRSVQTAQKQGTGLGLSIARGMVEAMGGRIWAADREDGASGLRMVIAMPAAEAPARSSKEAS